MRSVCSKPLFITSTSTHTTRKSTRNNSLHFKKSFPVLSLICLYVVICLFRANLFQELLFRRTNITPSHQDFLYEGQRLVLDPNRQAQTFPKTSRDNPIMLLSRDPVNTVGLVFEDRQYYPSLLTQTASVSCDNVCDVRWFGFCGR